MTDDEIMNGRWHKCECGADWSDSDGGPCHYTCEHCGTEGIDRDETCECDSAQLEDERDRNRRLAVGIHHLRKIVAERDATISALRHNLAEQAKGASC